METNKMISFTVQEINDMLGVLGDVPAKYSLDLIAFIKGKAQEQLKEVPQGDSAVDAEVVG